MSAESSTQAARTPEELRRDLDALRTGLGETVEELAHRADVPARVRSRRDQATEQVRQQVARARAAVAEKAPVARDTVRDNPALTGAVTLVLSYLLVARLRRRAARRP